MKARDIDADLVVVPSGAGKLNTKDHLDAEKAAVLVSSVNDFLEPISLVFE